MVINWASGAAMYNTIMAVAVGVALLMLLRFGHLVLNKKKVAFQGWSLGFAVLGFILTATGLHMTLTWTLAKLGFPFDNIIFGEPSLAFGVMLLAGAFLIWKKKHLVGDNGELNDECVEEIVENVKPLSYFAGAMGLAELWITAAGIYYKLYAAPPQEPIDGSLMSAHPYLEAIGMSSLFALTGIGAILMMFFLSKRSKSLKVIIFLCWLIAGISFLMFGCMNYFTHIGLVINTMQH
jgi:uncharacterized membrane protein